MNQVRQGAPRRRRGGASGGQPPKFVNTYDSLVNERYGISEGLADGLASPAPSLLPRKRVKRSKGCNLDDTGD